MFALQWSILNLAEFKAEMFSRYNLSEPPLEGTMYAYETVGLGWVAVLRPVGI